MTIEKAINNFYQIPFEFSLLNLFNTVCKDSSTSLRQFSLLERAQRMFFCIFPEESFFRNAGHSFHSSVLVVELNCPLHIIKEFSTLDNNFALEFLLEKCTQTVQVLVVETAECIHFL